MRRKRDCVNELENKQISHEMAFIMHNQKALANCFEHLSALSRIVKQLKAGRFVQGMVRNVNTVVSGLDQQYAATTSAPDAGMAELIDELKRTRTVWHKQAGNLQTMLQDTGASQEEGEAVEDDEIRKIQQQILQDAELERQESEALEDEARDARFRQLVGRHAPPAAQAEVPAVS